MEISDTAILPVSLPGLESNRVTDMWQISATKTTTINNNRRNAVGGNNDQHVYSSARFLMRVLVFLAIVPTLPLTGLVTWYIVRLMRKKRDNQHASEAIVLARVTRRSERKAGGERRQGQQMGILKRQMARYL